MSTDYFELSELESKSSRAMIARWLGWLALAALVISTGVHAVSLVISQIGLESGIMSVIRVASPILVEAIAAIVAIGFTAHAWRASQKMIGFAVEILWLIFAALNLVTSFNLEGGADLAGLLWYWLHYGLPLSALIAGALFYMMVRADPEHRRQAELQATQEAHHLAEFAARRDVLVSPQMGHVLRQRGWLKVVSELERQGFSAPQIDFMLQGVPQLESVVTGSAAGPENGVASLATGETAVSEPGVTKFTQRRRQKPARPTSNGKGEKKNPLMW